MPRSPKGASSEVAELRFVLPFPPSVNRYYRHVGRRTLLSREGRNYREVVLALLAGRVRQPLTSHLQVELDPYPPDRTGTFMKHVCITIQGVTPLLCNRFTDVAQLKATSGNTMASIGDRGTPHQQAEARLYVGHDGRPMIPQPNLFRCVIDAGKYFKAGRSKVTTQKSSLIPACVSIEELEIPIRHQAPWSVDTRPVRIPSTGGRILCHRPCFEDWELDFTIRVDPDLLSLKLLREIVDAAGKRVGLGDFRPDCKGPFGRFVVTRWKEERPAE